MCIMAILIQYLHCMDDIYVKEVRSMIKEVAYTISADKSKEFLKKLCATAPSKSDWERIKQESQIIDKEKLDKLFEEDSIHETNQQA